MMRCGKTGAVLLHGTGCVRCDCGGARVTFRGQEWTIEELERASPHITADAEAAIRREAQRRQDRAMDEAMADLFGRNPYQRQSRTAWTVDDPGYRGSVEIITDPNDRRGFDARPIGAR